jgi:hypothetical protein
MDPAELAARRIADRGRDALVTRLRVIFAETAAAREEGAEIDSRRLEEMVQTAVDRADGALWRRALATVAMDELGISLGEAVEHPAVRRAQEMLGVPAYEPGVAEPGVAEPEEAEPDPAEPDPAEPDPAEPDPAEPDPAEPAPAGPEPAAAPERASPAGPALSAIRVAAIHLGGIETLREGARHIELRFSDAGLDVIDTRDGESIGRLTWEEISSLELPRPRRSLRRRRPGGMELVVTTERGRARFELPDLDEEQSREHLAPVLDRARGARAH